MMTKTKFYANFLRYRYVNRECQDKVSNNWVIKCFGKPELKEKCLSAYRNPRYK